MVLNKSTLLNANIDESYKEQLSMQLWESKKSKPQPNPGSALILYVRAPSKKKSVLEGTNLNALVLQDPKTAEALYDQRCITAKNLNKHAQYRGSVAKTTIYFDPHVFQIGDDHKPTPQARENLNETLKTDKGGAPQQQDAEMLRLDAKHKVVVTTNSVAYATASGESIEQGFELAIATGAAPNLMGSSAHEREIFGENYKTSYSYRNKCDYYTDGTLRDPKAYKELMTLLFKRWLYALDQAGTQAAIIPLMGGGAYLKVLSEEQQEKAITLIEEALIEAINDSTFNNIQEIIHVLPDDKTNQRGRGYKQAYEEFKQFNPNHEKPILTLANGDVLACAKSVFDKGLKPGILNPGSDRTIGGAYISYEHHAAGNFQQSKLSRPTLEEVLSNLTTLVYDQALDKNPELENNENLVTFPYTLWAPEHLIQSQLVSNQQNLSSLSNQFESISLADPDDDADFQKQSEMTIESFNFGKNNPKAVGQRMDKYSYNKQYALPEYEGDITKETCVFLSNSERSAIKSRKGIVVTHSISFHGTVTGLILESYNKKHENNKIKSEGWVPSDKIKKLDANAVTGLVVENAEQAKALQNYIREKYPSNKPAVKWADQKNKPLKEVMTFQDKNSHSIDAKDEPISPPTTTISPDRFSQSKLDAAQKTQKLADIVTAPKNEQSNKKTDIKERAHSVRSLINIHKDKIEEYEGSNTTDMKKPKRDASLDSKDQQTQTSESAPINSNIESSTPQPAVGFVYQDQLPELNPEIDDATQLQITNPEQEPILIPTPKASAPTFTLGFFGDNLPPSFNPEINGSTQAAFTNADQGPDPIPQLFEITESDVIEYHNNQHQNPNLSFLKKLVETADKQEELADKEKIAKANYNLFVCLYIRAFNSNNSNPRSEMLGEILEDNIRRELKDDYTILDFLKNYAESKTNSRVKTIVLPKFEELRTTFPFDNQEAQVELADLADDFIISKGDIRINKKEQVKHIARNNLPKLFSKKFSKTSTSDMTPDSLSAELDRIIEKYGKNITKDSPYGF